MKIAVLIDQEGNTVSFYEPGVVKLFSYENGIWSCVREFPFAVHEEQGLAEIQCCIRQMLTGIDDCRTLILKFIKGVPLAILKETGIAVWTAEGSPLIFFDEVREKTEHCTAEQVTITSALPEPLPVGDSEHGIYAIDLVTVQQKGVGYNSKDILLPFLQKQRFQKLEVVCEHLPKWFEKELDSLKLQCSVEQSSDDLCHAILSPIE